MIKCVSYVDPLSHVVYHPWPVLVLSLKGTFRVVNTGSVRVRDWPDQILLLWSHGVPPLSGLEVVFLTSERWQRQWLLRKWNPLLKFLTSSIEIAYWKIYLGISFFLVVILVTTFVGSRPFPCSITGGRRVHRLWPDCDGIFDCVWRVDCFCDWEVLKLLCGDLYLSCTLWSGAWRWCGEYEEYVDHVTECCTAPEWRADGSVSD